MTSHPSPVTRHLILALIGANGMLAQAILQTVPDCYEVHCYDLPEFNMTDREQVLSTLDSLRPDIVINCAAFTNVDGCETQEDLAVQVNGTAVGFLAEAVRRIDATLVHISTDYVFDGNKREPYLEEDKVAPQSAYGRSKLVGEQAILGSGLKKYFIVRTSWLYGPGGNNFVETMIRLAAEREELRIVSDQIGSPTFTHDLAEAIFNLLKLTDHSSPVTRHSSRTLSSPVTAPYGLYHFSNSGQCSWHQFAEEIIALARQLDLPVKTQVVQPIATEEYPLPAKRPAYSVFSKEKYQRMTGAAVPEWRDSLALYLRSR